MSETVRVSLPDGSAREFPAGVTVLEVAEAIGPRLARDTVAGLVDDHLVDFRTSLDNDVNLRIITSRDPEAGEVIRHSAEHVLADVEVRVGGDRALRRKPFVGGQRDRQQVADAAHVEDEVRRVTLRDLAAQELVHVTSPT